MTASVLKALLEVPLFTLAGDRTRLLKYEPLHPRILDDFLAAGWPLSPDAQIVLNSGAKYRIRDGSRVFVLRFQENVLSVSREAHPSVSRIVQCVTETTDWLKWRLKHQIACRVFETKATIRKRMLDGPDRRMVNLGAGRWYEKGWTNLDHSGSWYHYGRYFVDYEYDLARFDRMPFDDNSVYLFYSEHVFEHLPDACCAHAFAEVYRSLVPGGGFRIVVPDADLLYTKLEENDAGFFEHLMAGRHASLAEAFLILIAHPRMPFDEEQFTRDFRALPKTEFFEKYTKSMKYDYRRAGEHINWFNREKTAAMLERAGFCHWFSTPPQGSRFPEMRGRGFDTRPTYSLHLDALKV